MYPNAKTVLETLANHHTIGLLTSSVRANIEEALKFHKLTPFFEIIISGDDVTHHKPHPEGILTVLTKTNTDPSSAIMIGDSDKDLGAANAAYIDSILFFPAHHQNFYDLETYKNYHPTFIIGDFLELIDILN